MLNPFGPRPILVSGTPHLVERVIEGLGAAGRRVSAVVPDGLRTLSLTRVQTLILADPPDAAGLVASLSSRLTEIGPRREPLRLILMHGRGRAPELPPAEDGPLQIETFAIEDRAARAVLARWPLHTGMDPPFGQVPHLLIAGFAPPAEALLVQALRLIQYGEPRPLVSIATNDPEGLASDIHTRYPQAEQIAELCFTPLANPRLAGSPPVSLAAVCERTPERGLETARALVQDIAGSQQASPPILLEIGDARPAGDLGDWDGQILPFSYLREACRADVLLDGSGDRIARGIHDHYRDSIAAQGRDPTQEAAGQTWERLAATYRDANRHQADHMLAKLAVVDCRAVEEERVESFAFAPLEIERLAVIEHQRWAADRYLDGWSYAPVRDNALRHHPQLIAFADLSEPMKDLDRLAVRGVPTLLGRSGLGVVRTLIVGVPEPHRQCRAGRRLDRLLDQLLERLLTRYPDRALILASTLGAATARQVVRRAVETAGAGLFLLCPHPLQQTLDAQPDDAARHELLALAARAERRISLPGDGELDRWLAERAEILLDLGERAASAGSRKRVLADTTENRLVWTFEY